jgi:hypothetical protein
MWSDRSNEHVGGTVFQNVDEVLPDYVVKGKVLPRTGHEGPEGE